MTGVRAMLACAPAVEMRLRQALEGAGDITVKATGHRAESVSPAAADVLVVDMDSLGIAGLALTAAAMRTTPLPILALCPDDGRKPTAAEAMQHGAVDAVSISAALASGAGLLRRRVHVVSGVAVVRRNDGRPAQGRPAAPGRVVAIGASTGGPAAAARVLAGLRELRAPVLLVQHLREEFMNGFVSWLAVESGLPVGLAAHGDLIQPGRVYVAPAGRHLRLGPDRRLVLADQPVTVHRPSVDELFTSVAAHAGPKGVGVLLTGMGTDGAAGLLAIRRAGGRTVAQDESTSAVFGMPGAAVALGAADFTLPLEAIAEAVRSISQAAVV